MARSRMNATEAVAFRNRTGCQLIGILHEPVERSVRDMAVVLLSPGIKSRVAPHRLYKKLAAHFADHGLATFRFDFYGLGDSEGQLTEEKLRDVYGAIQVGRYVTDTEDALDWLQARYGFSRFVLGGLCGGALTGLLEAQTDDRVTGILALGLPVSLDSASIDVRQYMTTGQLVNLREKYVRKLASLEAWRRFLSFKTDYRLLLRSLKARRRAREGVAGPQPRSNVNPHFAPAFFRTLERGCPILMVFSGADRLYWEFEEKFLTGHKKEFARYRRLIDLHVIQDANHVLTFPEWQEELKTIASGWLRNRLSLEPPAAGGPDGVEAAAWLAASQRVSPEVSR